MLLHLEREDCGTDLAELAYLAQECYQSPNYVVSGYEEYLRDGYGDCDIEVYPDYYTGGFECSECGNTFETENGASNHAWSPVHKPQVFGCPGCDSCFSSLSGLFQHVESNACSKGIFSGTRSLGHLLRFLKSRIGGR